MKQKQTIYVVAALIKQENKYLICKRPKNKARGLLWEFVGGKIEAGETPQQALCRECREELAIEISVGEKFMELEHEYDDVIVCLSLWNSAIVSGEPQKLEHEEICWVTAQQMDEYEFCPADKEILEKIKKMS